MDPVGDFLKLSALYMVLILGGPYAAFGGRDASRGLATFSVSAKSDEYDDLSDLNTMEMESVREWEAQFKGQSIKFQLTVYDIHYLWIYLRETRHYFIYVVRNVKKICTVQFKMSNDKVHIKCVS